MDDKVFHYDYLALQVYWDGTRNFESKSQAEQSFLKSFFAKYQILILTEEEYQRDDKKQRIQTLGQRFPHLLKGDVRANVMASFHADLNLLMGNRDLPKREEIVVFPQEQVVMGHGDWTEKEGKEATKQAANDFYETDEKGAKRSSEEKKALLTEFKVKDKKELEKAILDAVTPVLGQFAADMNQAMQIQFEKLGQAVYENTKTQLDGLKAVQRIEVQSKKQAEELANQAEMMLSDMRFTNVPFTKMPTWLKVKCVSGLKRLGIMCATLPLGGPAAIINEVVVAPISIVIGDVMMLKRVFQRVLGYVYVGFFIAGVWVVMYHPEYDETRKSIYSYYANIDQIIPVKNIVIDPSAGTVKFLWELMPSSIFFKHVTEVLWEFVKTVPGYLLSWSATAVQAVAGVMKQAVIEAVKDWWSGR